MKQAARRPARAFQTSRVSRNAVIEVRPLRRKGKRRGKEKEIGQSFIRGTYIFGGGKSIVLKLQHGLSICNFIEKKVFECERGREQVYPPPKMKIWKW